MTLKDWLTAEAVEVREFAQRINRTAEAVRRYVNGDRIPDRDTMPLIVGATLGAVTPNDFFGISASPFGRVVSCAECGARADHPSVSCCTSPRCPLARGEQEAA